MTFRTGIFLGLVITTFVTGFSVLAIEPEKPFDRLDGTGESKKRVDVIEWEGNLEIHVYPKGSLSGLSAWVDKNDTGQKVMILGYRFSKNQPHLIRRAILGVPFEGKVLGFKNPKEKDFDHIALSTKPMGHPWVPYPLDVAPKQKYPDGHPKNLEQEKPLPLAEESSAPAERKPASEKVDLEEGQIQHFNW